jgi:hypothetical protein
MWALTAEGDHEQSEWNDGFVALKTGPGDRTGFRVCVSATVEENGRPGTRLRRIASGRKQTQVHRPMADTDRRWSPAIAKASRRPDSEAASLKRDGTFRQNSSLAGKPNRTIQYP